MRKGEQLLHASLRVIAEIGPPLRSVYTGRDDNDIRFFATGLADLYALDNSLELVS